MSADKLLTFDQFSDLCSLQKKTFEKEMDSVPNDHALFDFGNPLTSNSSCYVVHQRKASTPCGHELPLNKKLGKMKYKNNFYSVFDLKNSDDMDYARCVWNAEVNNKEGDAHKKCLNNCAPVEMNLNQYMDRVNKSEHDMVNNPTSVLDAMRFVRWALDIF